MKQDSSTPRLMTRRGFASGSLATAAVMLTGSGTLAADDALERALAEARVQLIPGSLMQGGEGLVRVSYATSLENIEEGISRLHNWLTQIS